MQSSLILNAILLSCIPVIPTAAIMIPSSLQTGNETCQQKHSDIKSLQTLIMPKQFVHSRFADTPVTLKFNDLGSPIEPSLVVAILNVAIADFISEGATRVHDPITSNQSHSEWKDNGGRAMINVSANVPGHRISWLQLGHVLSALQRFINGCQFGQQNHFQNLKFSIEDENKEIIGVGILSNDPHAPQKVSKRTDSSITNTSLSLKSPNASLDTAKPLVTLQYTLFETLIPADEMSAALESFYEYILPYLRASPHQPITSNSIRYRHFNITIRVDANPRQNVSWQQLHAILVALGNYMIEMGHLQVLTFEVEAWNIVRIGHGLVYYAPPKEKGVQRRRVGR